MDGDALLTAVVIIIITLFLAGLTGAILAAFFLRGKTAKLVGFCCCVFLLGSILLAVLLVGEMRPIPGF